jgi:transcriptional regulator with XRE-family HTH domain
MDREQLADFLRRRRAALQPEDVGMPRGPRRRTSGLRREEVASLASMSTDYYARLEQARSPQPSPSMLAAIARGIRLSLDERDHLFRLAGHEVPSRAVRSDHVSPALMRVLDRLDTPAQVVSDLGETLAQNAMAVALVGEQTHYTGFEKSLFFRWFTAPRERLNYPEEDRDHHERVFVGGLRAAVSRDQADPFAHELVAELRRRSPEFAAVWAEHEVGIRMSARKRMVHPTIGVIALDCQKLTCENDTQALLVYTATPGTEDAEKLALLSVVGRQEFAGAERA